MTIPPTTFGLFSFSINSWFRWQALQGKVARAHRRFAHHHRSYADSLFDMHFLTHAARPLLERYLTANPPAPAEFALAWCAQFPGVAPSQTELAEATRVATAFLRHLGAELYSSSRTGL